MVRQAIGAVVVVLALAGLAPAWADYDTGKRAWDAGRPAEALEQWLAAADAEDRRAMLALGRPYLQGLGAPQDYVLAHMWFNLAASRGAKEAIELRDAPAAKTAPPEAPAGPPPARAVRQAQALLAAFGYKPGPADGKWGRRTAAVVNGGGILLHAKRPGAC